MRIMRRLVGTLAGSVIAAAAIVQGAPATNAIEYADNGSFETGTDGWYADGGMLDAVGSDVVEPADGSWSARAVLSGAPFLLRQPRHAGLPAGTYQFTISVRAGTTAVPVSLHAVTGDPREGAPQQDAVAFAGSWTRVTLGFTTATTSDITVSVAAQGAPGTVVFFDDARLDGPAPGVATVVPAATSTAPEATATLMPSITATPTASATRAPTATPDHYVGELRNAGFEDVDAAGALTAWRHIGGSLSAATAPSHSGNRAARFESTTDSTKWLYQTVAVAPDKWFEFSAWVLAVDAGVSASFLRVSWYASPDGSGSAIANADSEERLQGTGGAFRRLTTGAISAPAGAHTARLRVMLAPVSSAQATLYVDDAQFIAAAPATPTFAPNDSTATRSPTPRAATARASRDSRGTSNVLGAAHAPAWPGARVVINEVMYDPDDEGSDAEAEWVELYNAGDADQPMTGWTLADGRSTYTLPVVAVSAGSFAILAVSDSFREQYPSYSGPLVTLGGRIGNSLRNDGDRLVLKDAAGALVDAISWGDDTSILRPAIADVPEGHSIERRVAGIDSDSASDFVDNRHPSPGAPFEPSPASPERQAPAARPVPVLVGSGQGIWGWLPWAVAAMSGVALVGAVAWRGLPALRKRSTRTR